jgi:hypothetical protein
MSEPPIACSLDAGDQEARKDELDALARDALLERRDLPNGVRLRLRSAPEVEQRTRRLVAAERQCCPFLGFSLHRTHHALELEITGPDLARPIIDRFFSAADP